MSQKPLNPLQKFLKELALACYRAPKVALSVAAATFFASILLTSASLDLKMDWTYLFEEDDPVVERVQAHREIFPFPGDIAVLVDHGTPAARQAYIEELAARLAEEPEVFFHVIYKFNLDGLRQKALYYLSVEQLQQLANGLGRLEPDAEVGELSPAGKKLLNHLLSELKQSLRNRGRFHHTPLWEVMADDASGETVEYLSKVLNGEREVYSTIGNGHIYVLALKTGTRGKPLAKQSVAVERLRQLIDELAPMAYGLRVRLTGLPVMLNDERATCTSDSVRSALVSMVLILIVFVAGFGEATRPVMAVTALSCGLGWTLGYTTLAVGHLNFITVTMVTMLMGLGIDFGIHLIFRFAEEKRNGHEPEDALAITMVGTGVDTFVGALATAAAFLALTQAGFRGIADLGVIAAGGVLLCFLSTITVLPALLALQPRARMRAVENRGLVAALENKLLSNSRRVAMGGAGLCVLALLWSTQVHFDYNLLNVQAQELESIRTEREMIRELNTTVLSATCVADNLEQARELTRKLEALPTVARVSSVVPLLPDRLQEKQPLVEDICAKASSLQVPAPFPLEGVEDLRSVERYAQQYQERFKTRGGGDSALGKRMRHLKTEIAAMDPGPIEDGLSSFQQAVHADLVQTLRFLQIQKAEPPTLEDIPEALRIRCVSPDGHIQLKVQPKKNIWEREHLTPFLEDLRSVDQGMIGHPVVQNHILEAFGRSHRLTPWFTLLGVLGVMFLYLRHFGSVMLSLLPTATGVICIIGAMGYGGIDFNVVNFVALPMSVGIGAVYGVHALHRMREQRDEAILTSSTGPALLLSGVTTMVGFASLMTAHHRGLASLGFVIAIGVAVNFLVSLFILPSVSRWWRERKH